MTNINPLTNVRYGVISLRSIDDDLAQELMHGPDAINLTYEEAYEDAKTYANRRYDDLVDDAKHDNEDEPGCERDEYVEALLEEFSDCYQCENETFEGEYEGVKYRISSLGGGGLLWVLEGPVGHAYCLCSPCVPNAADLDAGFYFEGEEYKTVGMTYECYCVPRDWLRVEHEFIPTPYNC